MFLLYPAPHTQAKSLDELQINLEEVISLCMEELTDGLQEKKSYL
jgi:predicted RNase H-like HicB family nuclease